MTDDKPRPSRLHGRVHRDGACEEPGCCAQGEFRAPLAPGGFDGPGLYRWLCLDHVREFNAGYNYFRGMSPDEIADAQTPYAGWERETRAFATAGADRPPRWADFNDPLEAISGRFRKTMPQDRKDGRALSGENRRDLKTMGLDVDADRRALRTRYLELVRRYHPDRNGGDRSHEKALREAIDAYNRLKGAAAFA
jgi:DnaJ domain